MSAEPSSRTATRAFDKQLLQQWVAALYARLGLSQDPGATGEQAQALSLRDGIRPGDCVASQEVLRMRQEHKEQPER
jgi:hypothetical protein